MSKSVVDENGSGEREDLGFVLEASEGGRENEAVVVPLKVRTGLDSWVVIFLES